MKLPPFRRVAILLLLGLASVLALHAYRVSQLPATAPEEWQQSGREIIVQELATLRASPWGQTDRWRALCDQVQGFLDDGKIIFSAELGGPRGMWSRGFLLDERIYLRILTMKRGYLHQLPGQIMEAIIHEAVHSLRGHRSETSLQEECDAFAAGLVAELVVNGEPIPQTLMIDGMPLWSFIEQAYPDAPSNETYEPVHLTSVELYRLSGRE